MLCPLSEKYFWFLVDRNHTDTDDDLTPCCYEAHVSWSKIRFLVFRYVREGTGPAVAVIANASATVISSLTTSRSVICQIAGLLKTLAWTSVLGHISKVAVSVDTRWEFLWNDGPVTWAVRLTVLWTETPVTAVRGFARHVCHYQVMQPTM